MLATHVQVVAEGDIRVSKAACDATVAARGGPVWRGNTSRQFTTFSRAVSRCMGATMICRA